MQYILYANNNTIMVSFLGDLVLIPFYVILILNSTTPFVIFKLLSFEKSEYAPSSSTFSLYNNSNSSQLQHILISSR